MGDKKVRKRLACWGSSIFKTKGKVSVSLRIKAQKLGNSKVKRMFSVVEKYGQTFSKTVEKLVWEKKVEMIQINDLLKNYIIFRILKWMKKMLLCEENGIS